MLIYTVSDFCRLHFWIYFEVRAVEERQVRESILQPPWKPVLSPFHEPFTDKPYAKHKT
jgi:hypothetical protein